MDSISTQKVKPRNRKMKVVLVKKSRVQILLDMFYRVMEITVVMVTVAKLCYQLVITFQGSGLAGFLINCHLAFVLGNALVIAIIAKCGFFENQEADSRSNSNDFYDGFVRESSRGKGSLQSQAENETKQSVSENRAKQSREKKDITVKRHSHEKVRSENLEDEGSKKRSPDAFVTDDELRYKIESFIARQRRNQKDEEFCII